VQVREVQLEYRPTEVMVADMLTKQGSAKDHFETQRERLLSDR
jgi:hypothetical protein